MSLAESAEDPWPVASLLQARPGLADQVATIAKIALDYGATWHALLHAVGMALADTRSEKAIDYVRELVDAKGDGIRSHISASIPWAKLTGPQVLALVTYLSRYGALSDVERFYERISRDQLESARPPVDEESYLPWVALALTRGLCEPLAAQPLFEKARQGRLATRTSECEDALSLVEFVYEKACRSAQEPIPRWAASSQPRDEPRNLYAANGTGMGWDLLEGSRSPAPPAPWNPLRIISALWPLRRHPVDQAVLSSIAERLPYLGDDDVVRAADLLRGHPRGDWVAPLRAQWLAMDDRVRREYSGGHTRASRVDRGSSTHLEIAAGAVLSALGFCAAHEPSHRNFDHDERLAQGLGSLIDEHHRLSVYHNGLVAQYRARATGPNGQLSPVERELAAEIKRVRDDVSVIDRRIEELRGRRAEHSPGFLLWWVVRQMQAYPIVVRQGAAWGLHAILKGGALDEPTASKIERSVRDSVAGEENRDFRERRVQLLKGQGVTELSQSLREGLEWAAQVAEGPYARPPASSGTSDGSEMPTAALPVVTSTEGCEEGDAIPTRDRLDETVALMCELMPQALPFLTTYPLRLMPLDDHRQILGQYIADGCGFSRWTRYTGAQYSGEVHERDLILIDRSTPNSLGIYYKLFRNPLLALPVLYHEHLHFGGPGGVDGEGIANEAEVLLREIIFARGLIARMAEGLSDHELPSFEGEVIQEALKIGVPGLPLQWLCDFQNPEVLRGVNRMILDTYGKRLDQDEAALKLNRYYLEANVETQLANDTQAAYWCPEVRWPYLGQPETRDVTQEYGRILMRRWQCRHQIAAADCTRILQDPANGPALAAWLVYRGRSGACRVLASAQSELGVAPEELYKYLVRRIIFEPGSLHLPAGLRARVIEVQIHELLQEIQRAVGAEPDEPGYAVDTLTAPILFGGQAQLEGLLDDYRQVMLEAEQEGDEGLVEELSSRLESLLSDCEAVWGARAGEAPGEAIGEMRDPWSSQGFDDSSVRP